MTTRGRSENRRRLVAACVILFAAFVAGGLYDGSAAESRDWPRATYYTIIVRPGDTLAKLALRYAVSSGVVAHLNGLDTQSDIHAGEVLRVPAATRATREAVLSEAVDPGARNYAPPPRPRYVAPMLPVPREMVAVNELPLTRSGPVPSRPEIPAREENRPRLFAVPLRFVWPVTGAVISPFGKDGDGERNDGINIAAELGAPIHAAAAGTVTYAGNELKGYGNLILIAHDGGYVTAYAHAQSIAVNRGDRVERGQVIGAAGESGGVDRPQLHFEIRHGVRPINPRLLLAANP